MKVAINGLGRMGRCLFRAIYGHPDIHVVAINCTMTPESCAYFIKWDSVHGRFPHDIRHDSDWISVDDGERIKITNVLNPANIDWSGIDAVIECSGKFKKVEQLKSHLNAGAKRVLVSAPIENTDDPSVKTVIYGVNHESLLDSHKIISASSCTSNALVPAVNILHKAFGITSGFFVTVHAYTNDQSILDANHKDLRRSRAGAVSMIPTTSGCSETVGALFPDLAGKIKGYAVRVPVPNVSLVNFTFCAQSSLDERKLRGCFEDCQDGVITVTDEKLVSVDFMNNSSSGIIDLEELTVITPQQGHIMIWYDNEWGFVCRMADILQYMNATG